MQAHVHDPRVHGTEVPCGLERPCLESEVWKGWWAEVAKCGESALTWTAHSLPCSEVFDGGGSA